MEAMVSCITKNDDFDNLINENHFVDTKPTFKNSSIKFKGNNNILFCEPNVALVNSKITFNADNSLIYLSSNRNDYQNHETN